MAASPQARDSHAFVQCCAASEVTGLESGGAYVGASPHRFAGRGAPRSQHATRPVRRPGRRRVAGCCFALIEKVQLRQETSQSLRWLCGEERSRAAKRWSWKIDGRLSELDPRGNHALPVARAWPNSLAIALMVLRYERPTRIWHGRHFDRFSPLANPFLTSLSYGCSRA